MREPMPETPRLVLRKIVKGDADDIVRIYSDEGMFTYTNSDMDLNADPFVVETQRVRKWIEAWEADQELMCWGIELKSEKKLIGRVYLYGFVGNETAGYRVDIGYSLSGLYAGNGYATEAVRRVVEYGFSCLNIVRFQAEIIPENIASIKVCEKNGFRNEGVLRKYAFYDNNGNCFRDVVMMALTEEGGKRVAK